VGGQGWGPVEDERERAAALERAVERGITFFDTAPAYGTGASEVLIGRAVRGRREHVAIATKVGPQDDPRTSLEASLRRLGSDYVDLVQLHEARGRWEWQLEQLYRLHIAGKAGALGLCNATHLQIARALELVPLASYQGAYNLCDRDVEQRELPLCLTRGLAFLAYRPLASGLLTGKHATPPVFTDSDHRRALYWFRGLEFARRQRVLERLRPLAAARDTTLAALALAWLLTRPGVAVVLAGARNAAQVDENLVAAERPLAAQDAAAIDEIVAMVFRPPRIGEPTRALAADWGMRERYIVEQLDGERSYEAIAAAWTDRGEQPMIAAQVKVFVDQLAAQGLVAPEPQTTDHR
jgi:aryl-alcohol dehydrogenase-like predicted oxidoreductase